MTWAVVRFLDEGSLIILEILCRGYDCDCDRRRNGIVISSCIRSFSEEDITNFVVSEGSTGMSKMKVDSFFLGNPT
jgi:hypothetical protein